MKSIQVFTTTKVMFFILFCNFCDSFFVKIKKQYYLCITNLKQFTIRNNSVVKTLRAGLDLVLFLLNLSTARPIKNLRGVAAWRVGRTAASALKKKVVCVD